MYRRERCWNWFGDGCRNRHGESEGVEGVTFVWDWERSLLREGRFDLKGRLIGGKESC